MRAMRDEESVYLITTTHHLLAFDGKSRFFRVHSGKGLYYGLATDGDSVFVGCRNQTDGPNDADLRAKENGSILVLDARTLQIKGELRPAHFPLRDIHGIGWRDGKLYVTCSFDNMVAVCDLAENQWTQWFPSPDPSARGRDVHHFNTVVVRADRIELLAHNNGPSHLLVYDRETLELCAVSRLGVESHDIFELPDGLATCSSGEGMLVGHSGWALRTGAFPRGVMLGDERLLVGLSELAPREKRHEATGIVREFTPDWRFQTDYVLRGVGMILTILKLPGARASVTSFPAYERGTRLEKKYNSLEPGNVYRPSAENHASLETAAWHGSESEYRWTASRRACMRILVNPGETHVEIRVLSGFPGPYFADVVLGDQVLGRMAWEKPGVIQAIFPLPTSATGPGLLGFQVPHLWVPSKVLGVGDQRQLGVAVESVTLLDVPAAAAGSGITQKEFE